MAAEAAPSNQKGTSTLQSRAIMSPVAGKIMLDPYLRNSQTGAIVVLLSIEDIKTITRIITTTTTTIDKASIRTAQDKKTTLISLKHLVG